MDPYSIYGAWRRPIEDSHAELAAFVLFQTVLACTLTGQREQAASLIGGCLDHSEDSLQREMGGRNRRISHSILGDHSGNGRLYCGLNRDLGG